MLHTIGDDPGHSLRRLILDPGFDFAPLQADAIVGALLRDLLQRVERQRRAGGVRRQIPCAPVYTPAAVKDGLLHDGEHPLSHQGERVFGLPILRQVIRQVVPRPRDLVAIGERHARELGEQRIVAQQ